MPCDSSTALLAGFALIQALYLRIGGGGIGCVVLFALAFLYKKQL